MYILTYALQNIILNLISYWSNFLFLKSFYFEISWMVAIFDRSAVKTDELTGIWREKKSIWPVRTVKCWQAGRTPALNVKLVFELQFSFLCWLRRKTCALINNVALRPDLKQHQWLPTDRADSFQSWLPVIKPKVMIWSFLQWPSICSPDFRTPSPADKQRRSFLVYFSK